MPGSILDFYDRLGASYDRFALFDSRAKAQALGALELGPGLCLLNIGVGTGKEHAHIHKTVQPAGLAVGVDLSAVMAHVALQQSQAPICQAEAGALPFADTSFDRLFCAYVLDLIEPGHHARLLDDFCRLLRPGGLLVLLCLTEGVNVPSRVLVSLWKRIYALSPAVCGGCQPIQLAHITEQAGFVVVRHEVIVQLGLPSELITARKPVGE
jgi:demethylmenaquinone methyltransferase/2-methoxy-6-polyprenyl-1,4-benzoquinol methylase